MLISRDAADFFFFHEFEDSTVLAGVLCSRGLQQRLRPYGTSFRINEQVT